MLTRLHRVHRSLTVRGLDALLIGSRANILYLSGFSGSSGALLVREGEAILFTDSRYTLQAREEVEGVQVESIQGPPLRAALRAARPGARIGFEAHHVSVADHGALVAEAGGVSLTPVSSLVEDLRRVKDEEEIRRIERSVEVTAKGFEAGLRTLAEGASECEVAAAIEHEMRRQGAQGTAFESIVASGPRGAWPHARASERRAEGGEPVVVDIGAMCDGYASDMTRTVFVGEPDETGSRVHAAVLEGLRRAQKVVRAGVRASEVDAAARTAIEEAGFSDHAYLHGTGHGLGLEVHEAPRIGRRADESLAAGEVITIEPGVYVPGWGGVRIEDVVVVEEKGCRVITPTTKEIIKV